MAGLFDDIPVVGELVKQEASPFASIPKKEPSKDKLDTKTRVLQYKDYADKYGAEFGEDPALLLAMMHKESGGERGRVSSRGAEGLMQFMPATADEYGVEDPDDPDQAVRGAAKYTQWIRQQVRKLGVPAAEEDAAVLASYNWGIGNFSKTYERAKKAGTRWQTRLESNKETRDYVATVLALKHDYKADK